MDRESAATRRQFVKAGTGLAVGGALAGCADDADTGDGESGDGSYSVTMAPMGEVNFEDPPEEWMAYFSTYGDMGIALGQLDGLQALIYTENWPQEFYDALPGVDVSFDDVTQLMGDSGLDKESFYAVDADVHLMDPNFIQLLDDTWTDSDFDEVSAQVGPIVGNSIRRRGEDWHDYPYYSLYEAFEKIASVFDERERYEALRSVHDEMLDNIESGLPPEDDRPTVGLVSVNSDFQKGSFYVYPVNDGNGHKQYRDLGMNGAFDDHIEGGYAQWDYEQLLNVNPDILVFQYGFSHVSTEQFRERLDAMRSDPVGKKLNAVQNDRLYRGGTSYQGPLSNLFQTEAAAKQFYPDQFGAWNGLESLGDETLFDYQRVVDIIDGAV